MPSIPQTFVCLRAYIDALLSDSLSSQVDDTFLSEPPLDSVDEHSHILSESMQQAFQGFTYEAPNGFESVR